MKHWIVIPLMAAALSGCGDSGLNPFGWFGGQSESDVETLNDVQIIELQDSRPRIPRVTSLRVNRTPGGAIIEATGLPPQQGWHSAALVPVTDGASANGVLTFDFRAVPPDEQTRVSTVQSREVVVAYAISSIALQGVRTIRVVGAGNVLSARR